jgi:hypothetical protein
MLIKSAFLQLDVFASAAQMGNLQVGESSSEATFKLGCDVLHPIATRALELLNSLPGHAHFRKVLVAALLRDVDASSAAKLATVSTSEVYKSREQYGEANIGEVSQKYSANVVRERIPSIELDLLRAFIMEKCPAKSGQTREHYYQRITSDQLYAEYRDEHQKLMMRLLEMVNAGDVSVDSAALQTLISKIQAHEQQLAFLSFLRTDPASAQAFAGGHIPGPAQIVLDYVLDQMAVPSLPKPVSRNTFDSTKHEMPLTALHRYYGQFACATCARGLSSISELN